MFYIHSLRLERMPELIFDKFKSQIILAGRFRTGLRFIFVTTFYLLFDKPIESVHKLPTSLNERYHSDSNPSFSFQISKREFRKHIPELRIKRRLSVRGL